MRLLCASQCSVVARAFVCLSTALIIIHQCDGNSSSSSNESVGGLDVVAFQQLARFSLDAVPFFLLLFLFLGLNIARGTLLQCILCIMQ